MKCGYFALLDFLLFLEKMYVPFKNFCVRRFELNFVLRRLKWRACYKPGMPISVLSVLIMANENTSNRGFHGYLSRVVDGVLHDHFQLLGGLSGHWIILTILKV